MKGCVDSVILTDALPCLNFIKYLLRYWYDKWPKKQTDITVCRIMTLNSLGDSTSLFLSNTNAWFSQKFSGSPSLTWCLQTPSILFSVPLALFPSFPPKFFPSWHEDKTPLIWLEALKNNLLFFNSIHHYFCFSSNIPVWYLPFFFTSFQPSWFPKTTAFD